VNGGSLMTQWPHQVASKSISDERGPGGTVNRLVTPRTRAPPCGHSQRKGRVVSSRMHYSPKTAREPPPKAMIPAEIPPD
jgi:hypothetical protein